MRMEGSHTFIPVPQAMKNPDAKVAVDNDWENFEDTGMAADESQEQKSGDR